MPVGYIFKGHWRYFPVQQMLYSRLAIYIQFIQLMINWICLHSVINSLAQETNYLNWTGRNCFVWVVQHGKSNPWMQVFHKTCCQSVYPWSMILLKFFYLENHRNRQTTTNSELLFWKLANIKNCSLVLLPSLTQFDVLQLQTTAANKN